MTPTVLLLNDDLDIRLLWQLAIEASGLDIVTETASNGQEALAAARRLRFDALVLDVMVPGPSGLEVAEQLRAEAYGVTPMLGTNAGKVGSLVDDLWPFDAFVDMIDSAAGVVRWLAATFDIPFESPDWLDMSRDSVEYRRNAGLH